MPEKQSSKIVWPYIVGDIHGCWDEYLELENKIGQHAQDNQVDPLIVSVGDLIDRGPNSAAVVEHFFKGENRGTHKAILGNHEIMMLQILHHLAPGNFKQEGCAYPLWLWSLEDEYNQGKGMARFLKWSDYSTTIKSLWLSQGGYQTLTSYDMDPERSETWRFSPLIIQYLLNLPFYWESDQGVVTHALAQPDDLELVKTATEGEMALTQTALQKIREAVYSLLWNRSLPLRRPDPQREHISGHTPVPRVRRWKLLGCTQIDTGCVFGKHLTAFCLPNREILSVKAQRSYITK